MRRFRFTLERLLRLRNHEERASRRALAVAVLEVARLEHRLEVLERDLRALADADHAGGRMVALAQALEQGFRAEWTRTRSAREVAERTMQGKRAEYHGKRAARDGLARLRARRRADWLASAQQQEQGVIDEIARARAFAARSEVSE